MFQEKYWEVVASYKYRHCDTRCVVSDQYKVPWHTNAVVPALCPSSTRHSTKAASALLCLVLDRLSLTQSNASPTLLRPVAAWRLLCVQVMIWNSFALCCSKYFLWWLYQLKNATVINTALSHRHSTDKISQDESWIRKKKIFQHTKNTLMTTLAR